MKTDENQKKHWLYRPESRRPLWCGFLLILGLTVIAQLVIHVHGHFGFDEWFGFHAIYGLATCAIMVIFAKLLGVLLKRPEDYYDRDV